MTSTRIIDGWNAFSDVLALAASLLGVIVGLTYAIPGRDEAISFHGYLFAAAAGITSLFISSRTFAPGQVRALA